MEGEKGGHRCFRGRIPIHLSPHDLRVPCCAKACDRDGGLAQRQTEAGGACWQSLDLVRLISLSSRADRCY